MINKFPERLKELRLEKGKTQDQVVADLNGAVSQSSLAGWENARRVPTLDYVIILAQYFGVTLDYIAGLED